MKLFLPVIFIFFIQPIFSQIITINDDISFYEYNYNKAIIKQNKIKKVIIDSYSDSKIRTKFTFSFTKEGLLTNEIIANGSGKINGEYDFTCNSYGDLISIKHVDGESLKKDTITFYKSYEGSRLIKDSSNFIPISYNYEYNEIGQKIKTIIRNYSGSFTFLYKYDSTKKLIEIIEKQYSSEKDTIGGLLSHRFIFYNKFEKPFREEEIIRPRYNEQLMINKGSIRYTYDDKGNMTEIIRSNAASYKYTFNDMGLVASKNMSLVMDGKQTVSGDKFTYIFFK